MDFPPARASNMKSGAMFGTLMNYEDEDYWQEHKTIALYTKECLRNYEVIAVFRTQVYKKTDQVCPGMDFPPARASVPAWTPGVPAKSPVR